MLPFQTFPKIGSIFFAEREITRTLATQTSIYHKKTRYPSLEQKTRKKLIINKLTNP